MIYTLKVEQDPDPTSPREDSNVFTLFGKKGTRYNLADLNILTGDEEEDREIMEAELGKLAFVFPFYAYVHGGAVLSEKPFACPWDSGQVGWAAVSEKTIEDEKFGVPESDLKAHVFGILKSELKTFSMYLEGDVWGYIIEKDGDVVDSCWGYYGEDYAKLSGLQSLRALIAREVPEGVCV